MAKGEVVAIVLSSWVGSLSRWRSGAARLGIGLVEGRRDVMEALLSDVPLEVLKIVSNILFTLKARSGNTHDEPSDRQRRKRDVERRGDV